ncbi:hypothetical protein [[Clostridium] hylemonae]|nr:hypothetical protein [[Clostridium] hylemonae]
MKDEKNTKEELLAVIASKAGCNYLSDVILPIYSEKCWQPSSP